MSTPALPPILQQPDSAIAYEQAFDALGQAYWHASDIASKDLIHGTQMAIGDILDALDADDIAANTNAFLALTPKIAAVNEQLKQIRDSIATITKDIDTAATVLAAISKVLSLLPL